MVRLLHKFADDQGKYVASRQALHDKLLAKLFTPEAIAAATPAPGQRPTLTLLGGRGGSGKSWFTRDEKSPVVKGSLVINSDDFKEQLPEYKGWNADVVHEESSHLAGQAMEMAKWLGLNVIYDATMRNPGTFRRIIPEFKEAGYGIDCFFIHTAPHVAAVRAVKRFMSGGGVEGGGRWVPPEIILASHTNEMTFDEMKATSNRWALYDGNRSGPPHRCAKGGR